MLPRRADGPLTGRRKKYNTRASQTYNFKGNPYNQASIARKLGVTKSCLHNWEYGKSTPGSWEIWERWAKALNTKFEVNLIDLPDRTTEIAETIQRTFEEEYQ